MSMLFLPKILRIQTMSMIREWYAVNKDKRNKKYSHKFDNNLITVAKSPGYSLGSSVFCVTEKEVTHHERLYDAPHQRFCREVDFSEMEEGIKSTRQKAQDRLDKLLQRRLIHLVDTQNLPREKTS